MTYSNNVDPAPGGPRTLGTAIERLRHRWGWMVAFGLLVALFGVAALILDVSATIASVYTIAIFIIIAGAAEIATGIGAKSWGRFFLWILGGLLYIVAGAFALANPFIAAYFLTLMLGAGLIATGGVRIYLGTQLGKEVRGSVIFSGVLTLLIGILIVLGWPSNTPFVLGILLGVDLLFWGLAWVSFGFRLRRA
ncbi:HdeD family acid-resistance protein [Methylocapsa polymorpha]|uniref:HdeD family acid-resistance protein n=1 Tax=Methylocapsa polymorpha TaxID=3080828 RepID=A0ABZ0HQU7_9HYPH|nr:HdeD family acid-resistance protein [Methylocapsa sp. RX1]